MHIQPDDNPILIQGIPAPIFRSKVLGNENLFCANCHFVLIEGYYPDTFLDVSIQCFTCHEVTSTPPLDAGEILPSTRLVVFPQGKYRIGGTIEYDPMIAVTTNSHLASHNAACAPNEAEFHLDLTPEGLSAVSERFSILSGRTSEMRRAELNRYHKAGRSGSTELPFDWSIWKLEKCVADGVIDVRDQETNVALGRLHVFAKADAMWKHHPRYMKVASEFSNPNSYFHTVGQFVLAAALFSKGLRIGFTIQEEYGHSKPDLYLKSAANKKFYLEFKTPRSLIWEKGTVHNDEAIRQNIRSILKNSSQINRSKPGGYVIMANTPDSGAAVSMKEHTVSFFKSKGWSKRHVAGAITMAYPAISGGLAGFEMPFAWSNVANEHYEDPENPFVQVI